MPDLPDRPKGKPFSIRLTEAEKDLIRRKAGNAPLGAYLRAAALGVAVSTRSPPRPRPIKDHGSFAQLLGLLGQSRLSSNLNQLAKAASIGVLPLTEETENEVRLACKQITEMRSLLMAALGVTATGDSESPASSEPEATK